MNSLKAGDLIKRSPDWLNSEFVDARDVVFELINLVYDECYVRTVSGHFPHSAGPHLINRFILWEGPKVWPIKEIDIKTCSIEELMSFESAIEDEWERRFQLNACKT